MNVNSKTWNKRQKTKQQNEENWGIKLKQ